MKKRDTSMAIKKVSLSSLENFSMPRIKTKIEKSNDEDGSPEDKFYFVHILFLLVGLMHFIPFSFFVTANAYWMYKFRNTSADIMDTDARTILQTHFSPGHIIVNTTFTPTTMLLSTFVGYKIKVRVRLLVALGLMSLAFIAGTIFVKINTDSWQILLFVITMGILSVICCANSAMSASNLTILSKFPHYYMKVYLIGQGFGGIFNAVLQIVSLALGTSTEVSALFYFISGSSLMTLTFILFYTSKYNKLYNYYANSVVEDVTRDVMTLSEAKVLAKQIWSPILAFAMFCMTITPILPNISSLVVSENYGSGRQWTDKYFVPVTTFLYADVLSLMGRLASSKINKTFDGLPLCMLLFLRMVVFVPLVYFCNAQPRHHLPVIFHHDWQYTLILGLFTFSNGYVYNMVYLDVARLVGPEKVEDAYLVMSSCVSLATVLFLPIGIFSVDLL